MIKNLDIVLDGVIELIRIREFNKARERFFEAKKTVLATDFCTRKRKVREIAISIGRLNKTKQAMESAIHKLPEGCRFHAREGLGDVFEAINLQLNLLRQQRKKFSRSQNYL